MGNGCGAGPDSRATNAKPVADTIAHSIRFPAGAALAAGLLMVAAAGALFPGFRHLSPKILAPTPAFRSATQPTFLRTSASQSSYSQSSYSPSSWLQPRLSTSVHSASAAKPDARALLGQLPLVFEPNEGQAAPAVKFVAHGAGYSLALDAGGAILALQADNKSERGFGNRVVRMKLVGANSRAEVAGTDPLPGKSNYFTGSDPRQWHRGIAQFGGVRYGNVYPGIDLVFYGSQGHLEYDFRVAPGADPSRAELQFEGAGKLELSGGDLLIKNGGHSAASVRMRAPKIYQRDGEKRTPVSGHFVLGADNRVGFEVGTYDRSRELVIDPALEFSSFFGLVTAGNLPAVAVNNDGSIYLAGSTTSTTDFPTATTTLGTPHVFVARITPTSPPSLTYLTFLGGNRSDNSVGLGVDLGGNTYLVGNTTSTNFPTTTSAYQTTPMAKGAQCAGTTCNSMFVTAINADGTGLNYSSYVSGNGNDVASGMTINNSANVFLTGTTTSDNPSSSTEAFPATLTPVPFQSAPHANIQFFVTQVNTAEAGASGIAYSTYFGGSSPSNPVAIGGGIAVDSTSNIYFSGTTNFYNSGSGLYGNYTGGDFPIENSYQPCLDTIPPVVLLNPNPCAAPTAPYPTDAFMAKINPVGQSGAQLLFSTYLGGPNADTSTAITIDSTYIYITGSTNSPDMYLPPSELAYQACLNNPGVLAGSCPTTNTANTDAYVARFTNPSLSTSGTPNFVGLSYFSYLGGSGNEAGTSIAVDTANNALLTGYTNSTNFPVTTGAIQTALTGVQNAYFAHLNTNANATTSGGDYATYFTGSGTDSGTSVAVDIDLNTYIAGTTTSPNFQVPDGLQTTFNTPGPDAFVMKLATQSSLCISCVAPVVSPGPNVAAGNQVTITYTVSNLGPDVATGINVVGQAPTGVVFNSGAVSGSSSTGSGGAGVCSAASGSENMTCQIPTLQAGSSVNLNFVVTPMIPGTFEIVATVSNPNNTNTNNTVPASFNATSFTVAIAPSSQTVAAGQPAQYNVVVAPTQGVFGASVSLSCSGQLPTGTTCNFATSSLNLSSAAGSASTVLNLTTTAQPVNTASLDQRRPFLAMWLAVPGMAFLGLGTTGRGRRNRLLALIALMAFFAVTLLQPGCSKAKTQPTVSGTPSGTYRLEIAAASGTLTQTAPFVLTVIP